MKGIVFPDRIFREREGHWVRLLLDSEATCLF